MAGEMERWRPVVQPGGRPPAPGELALVQAFINTHYDLEVEHGAELLATPAGLAKWLAARGLLEPTFALDDRDLRRALAARQALRAAARANGTDRDATYGPLEELGRAAEGAPVEVRFGPAGPRFVGGDGGVCGAIGVLMAIAARSMIEGSWSRLKVCPGQDCGWAFYDYSRNQTGRWCAMSVCGGRAKARAHYQRRRGSQR